MSNLGKQVDVNWSYPLALTSQDKRVPLAATVAPYSHELAGVDGILQGGCRPISGFSKVHEFDFWDDPEHSYLSTVTDFFPVNFKIGFETYGYGFVYRATRSGTDLADIFFDFYIGACDEWSTGNKVMEAVSATEEMDVTIAGRSIFVFVRGVSPTLLFVNPIEEETSEETSETSDGDSNSSESESSSAYDCMSEYQLIIEDSPGPGKQPKLAGPVRTLGANADPNHWFQTTQPNNAAPGSGTLILTRKLPTLSTLFGVGEYVLGGIFNPYTLGHRSDEDARSALIAAMPGFDCDRVREESDIFSSSSEDSSGVSGDEDNLLLGNAITFLGSTPGGRRYPGGPFIDRDMNLYKVSTIESGNYIDQTTTITGYFRINRQLVDDDKLLFDLYFKEKNSEDVNVLQSVVTGMHLQLDEGVYDDHIIATSNDLGGTYATLNPATPFTAIAENLGPTGTEGVFYYRITVNIQDLFSDEQWVPGSYNYKWKIRALCGDSIDRAQSVSKEFQFDVAPQYAIFGKEDAIQGHEISSSEDTVYDDLHKLPAGNYSFAYQLFDSKTGRRSGLSEIVVAEKDLFINSAEVEVPLYAALDVVWDHTKYDRMLLWRTVDTSSFGLTGGGILSLEKIVTLDDHRILDPELENLDNDDYSHAFYIYASKDEVLQFKQPYPSGTPIFDEQLPYAGTAEFYEGTIFVSNIRNSPVTQANEHNINEVKRGLGELRWSSLTDYSPELFPPTNYFIPPTPTNEVIALESMGGHLLGFSSDRMYFIRKESGGAGALMRINEVHEGYGVINQNCATTVGSSSYFLTPRGLKSVNATGKLDDVGAFDYLIFNQWDTDLSSVSIAFDSASSALMILSPSDEEIACLWFNSSRATTIKDATFDQCREGVWPQDNSDPSSSLIDRALFLMNAPVPNAKVKPRVYILDYRREKTAVVDGTTLNRLTTLDASSSSIYTVKSIPEDSEPGRIELSELDLVADATISTDWIGGYVYVLSSSDESLIGAKEKLIDVEENIITLESFRLGDGGYGALASLPIGSVVGISPIYFRWVGYPLPLEIEGQQFSRQDYHRSKHVSSMSAAFTDVSSPVHTVGFSRFRGLLFENSIDVLRDSAFIVDDAGLMVDSIVDGQSVHWVPFGANASLDGIFGIVSSSPAPGLDIFVPDLDFRLMSVLVSGKLLPSYRTSLGL